MKKAISMLLLVVMVLALGASAAGCKGNSTGDGDGAGFTGGQIPGGTADVSADVLKALQNSGKVSVQYYVNTAGEAVKEDVQAWRDDFTEYFKQVYGGEIDYREIIWGRWEDTYVTQYASGDNADICSLFEKNFPKYANRGMVYSVEEM